MSADLEVFDEMAWLAWRADGLGASDVAAVVGISPWQSPYSLWAQKSGLTETEPTTERQRIGRALEAALAEMFTDRTGLIVAGEQTWCSHPDDPWMRATVDGFAFESVGTVDLTNALGAVEFKTDRAFGWPDGVPGHYTAQAQWTMAVTGLTRCWVGVLFSGFRFEVFEVDADPADQDLLRQAAGVFWHEHVLTGRPPPVDGSEATTRAIREVFEANDTDPDGVAVIDRALVNDWRWCKGQVKAAKDAETLAANRITALLTALGATEAIDDGGNLLVSWRWQKRKAYSVSEGEYPVLRYHGKADVA